MFIICCFYYKQSPRIYHTTLVHAIFDPTFEIKTCFVVMVYRTEIPLHISAIGSIICKAKFIFLHHNSIDILYKQFTAVLQVTSEQINSHCIKDAVLLHQTVNIYLFIVFVIQSVTCRQLLKIAMPGHFLFIISSLIKKYIYNISSLN